MLNVMRKKNTHLYVIAWCGGTGAIIGILVGWFWGGAFSPGAADIETKFSAAALGLLGGITSGIVMARHSGVTGTRQIALIDGVMIALLGVVVPGVIVGIYTGETLGIIIFPFMILLAVFYPLGVVTIPLIVGSFILLRRELERRKTA